MPVILWLWIINTYANGDWAGEPVGQALDGNYDLRSYFSFAYSKPVGYNGISPWTFIPNYSVVCVRKRIPGSGNPGTLGPVIFTAPLILDDFINATGSTSPYGSTSAASTSTVPYATDIFQNDPINYPGYDNFLDYLCSGGSWQNLACPYQPTKQNGAGQWYTRYTNEDDSKISEHYYLMFGKALARAGYTGPTNDDDYYYEVKSRWKMNEAFPWDNSNSFAFKGATEHYGNGNSIPTDQAASTFVGACNYATAVGLVVSKDLTIGNPYQTYKADCGLRISHKLNFKSFEGNYFRVDEVRVPYTLDKIVANIPAEYSIDPATPAISLKYNQSCAEQTYLGIVSSSNTGIVTFTNGAGGDFPRIDDCAGKTTAYDLCYNLIKIGTAAPLAYKMPIEVHLKDEWGVPFVLLDTVSITEADPILTISAIAASVTIADGVTPAGKVCSSFYTDYKVTNNSIYDAPNVYLAAKGGATVNITGIQDVNPATPLVEADTVRFAITNLFGKIGTVKANESRIIRVYSTTTACSGQVNVCADFDCNYPAGNAPDESEGNTNLVKASTTFQAEEPAMQSKAISDLNVTDLCGTKRVVFDILNTKNANLFDMISTLTLPAGVNMIAGSAKLGYGIAGSYSGDYAIPTANISGVGPIAFDLKGNTPFKPTECGLEGNDQRPNNYVRLSFDVEFTACPVGDLLLETTAKNYCGLVTTTKAASGFDLIGTTPKNNFDFSQIDEPIKICSPDAGVPVVVTDTVYVKNLGGFGALSGATIGKDTMLLSFPYDQTLLSMSDFIVPTSFGGYPVGADIAGNPQLKILIPAGLAVGDSLAVPVTYTITPEVAKLCESDKLLLCLSAEFKSGIGLECVAKGISCTSTKVSVSKGVKVRQFECTYVSIGSTVFEDKANNGIQDPTDPAIVGATVNLYGDSNGDGVISGTELTTPVATTTTGTDGKYLFDELFKGPYIVGVVPPAAIPNSSTLTVTADNQTDKDDNGTQAAPTTAAPIQEARSGIITLTPDLEPVGATESDLNAAQDDALPFGGDASGDMTVDFGFFTPYSIGSVAFVDADNDGVKDGGELPLAGLVVTLTDALGVSVTTTTAADGTYVFNNLGEGTYSVSIKPNTIYPLASTTVDPVTGATSLDDKNKGTQTALNDPSIVTGIKVGPGLQPSGEAGIGSTITGINKSTSTDANTNSTIDFGFLAPMSIGSTAFNDLNNNGIQDPTEPGIAGLVVNLYTGTSPIGAAITTTTTDANGNYIFENLQPGSYIVGVKPNGTAPKTSTGGTLGSDNQLDGDNNGTQPGGELEEAKSGLITLALGAEPTDATTETATGVGGAQDNGTLTDPNGDMTVDFGFFNPVSLGSTVFQDLDNDGKKDLGEAGIGGLTVELYYDADGDGVLSPAELMTPYRTTTTSPTTGEYIFSDIPEGNYVVAVAPSAAFPRSSTPTVTVDDQTDDDDNGTQAAESDKAFSPVIKLVAGGEPLNAVETGAGGMQDASVSGGDASGDMTVDFGFFMPVSIGSTVYEDKENNGIQDPTDPPIGATVNLYRDADGDGLITGAELTTSYATTTTGPNGEYIFSEIPEGKYMVGVKPIGATTLSSTTTVTADNQTDKDDNGTQASNGDEAFSPVITLKADSEPTDITESGTNGDIDNALSGGDDNGDMTVDFGFFTPVSLGSTVFEDLNNNGKQDSGETGIINGLRVVLYRDADGDGILSPTELMTPYASTTTDMNGDYIFKDIPAGTYVVGVTPLGTVNKSSTVSSADPNDNIDEVNDGTQASGIGGMALSKPVTLSADAEPTTELGIGGAQDDTAVNGGDASGNMTVDFGFYQPVSLGSTVFQDLNNNGKQDATEMGIDGLTVKLYQGNGTSPALGPDGVTQLTAITDLNGDYIFKDIPAGNYVVGVVPNTTYPRSSTTPDVTTDNQVDLDDNGIQAGIGTEVKSTKITLAADTEPTTTEANIGGAQDDGTLDANGDMTVDFGFFNPVSIGSNAFNDKNNDGIQAGPGELGIPNLIVKLYNSNGNPYIDPATGVQKTTMTAPNGDYIFTDLVPGSYIVGVTPNSIQNTSSTPPADGDTGIDKNDNGTQAVITAAVQTPEAKSGVIVLTVGGEMAPELGSGGNLDDGLLTETNGDMTVDFGFFTPYSIGSAVFNDANNDGVKGAGEAGIPTLTVILYDANGVEVTRTTTDADGNYVFNNLGEGTYTVGVTPSAGIPNASQIVDPTTGLASLDDRNDGTQAAGPGTISKSQPIVLGPGLQPSGETGTGTGLTTSKDENTNSSVDFGFYIPLSIGSSVFTDTNNNGMQDAGEPGIAGALVNLYKADGTTLVATTTSGADGKYIFTLLGQGSYVVGVTPVGTANVSSDDPASASTFSGDNQTDGDDNGVQTVAGGEAKSSPIALKAGTEPTDGTGTEASSNGTLDNTKDADGDMTVDFGFFVPAKLSNLVFQDLNRDGVQDTGEPGIGGVTVNLYDGEGNLVHTTVTDPNGEYIFENLRPGIPYTVKFTVPAGYSVSPTNVGDDATDSDGGVPVGGISSTGTYTLTSGENNKTADLGLYRTGALPLNLISFEAERASTQVNLTWKTANEVDFSHYEVQRSTNAKEFNSIGKVNGSNDKFYTLADTKPVVGNNYYRLKMVDKNGTYSVSKIQVVNFEESTEFLTVENPAANRVINLTTNVVNAKFNLASMNGANVGITTTHMGGDKYIVKVKDAAAGVYLINVTGDKSVITKKVILVD